MRKRKILIQKVKSQNRKLKSLLKLADPNFTQMQINRVKSLELEVMELTQKIELLKKEVYFNKTKVETLKKGSIFKRILRMFKEEI